MKHPVDQDAGWRAFFRVCAAHRGYRAAVRAHEKALAFRWFMAGWLAAYVLFVTLKALGYAE